MHKFIVLQNIITVNHLLIIAYHVGWLRYHSGKISDFTVDNAQDRHSKNTDVLEESDRQVFNINVNMISVGDRLCVPLASFHGNGFTLAFVFLF